MADSKEVTTREATASERVESETVIRPPVDIYEDAEGITLLADLPGVSKEGLNLQVEHDSLTVDAQASIDMPEGMEALYADVQSTHYRRRFTLSRELDSAGIAANLKDGVLRVHIPKHAEARPRRIEVRVD